MRNRIEYLEINEKSCDLIFEGIKESTYAEATSDVGSQDVKLTGTDTVSSVINCCREKFNIEVSPNDINSIQDIYSSECVRVSGLTKDLPRARIKFPRGNEIVRFGCWGDGARIGKGRRTRMRVWCDICARSVSVIFKAKATATKKI